MNDRDTFAAAALTGLLAEGDDGSFSEESYARAAYRLADAMLDFRDSRIAKETNHDAAPAAWSAWFDDEDKPDTDFLFSTKERADGWCSKRGAAPVPLYISPQPTLTDEERAAVEWAADNLDACGHGSATLRRLLARLA